MGEAATGDRKTGVGLRRRLLLTGSVAMGLLGGYGGRAYAACTVLSGTTYLCSGAETTTQTIAADNAAARTAPGFSVDTSGTGGDAITITGDGALSYEDAEGASLTGAVHGLYIHSSGDDGAIPGSVGVGARGAIYGGDSGILARNDGGGSMAIAVQGSVIGATYYGISAANAGGTHLSVTTGPGIVYGGEVGILATNFGSGDLAVAVGGDVVGLYGSAVSAAGLGSALMVTTASGTTLIGGEHGISARNFGSGASSIVVEGAVGGALHGIYAVNVAGTDLTITTAEGSTVSGGAYDGIYAFNDGSGALIISAGGTVGGGAYGIHAENEGTDLVVTGGAGSTISGGDRGIYGVNRGSGSLRIAVEGDVAGSDVGIFALNDAGTTRDLEISIGTEATVTGDAGIVAGNNGRGSLGITVAGTVNAAISGIYTYSLGENLNITTEAGSRVAGGSAGIVARNAGSGALTIEANGDVEGGIAAIGYVGATDLTVTIGPGSTVRNFYSAINAINLGSGASILAVEGDVVSDLDVGILALAVGTELTVTTAAGTTVSGGPAGLVATNAGSGATTIVIGGTVTGADYGLAGYGRTGLSMTLEEGSVVRGGYAGVYAGTYSGPLSITVEGEISADNGTALRAASFANGPITLVVSRHGSIVNEGADPSFFALDLSGGAGNVTLAGSLRGEGGSALRFDTFDSFDDRLELQPGFSATGDVLAGPGSDLLVFGGEGQASFDAGLIGAGSQFQDFERFRKEGASHWTLTGSSGAVADLTLDEGLLAVNGALPNARVLVNPLGTLGGSGSVGSVILGGGTVAPGNSIGTLTVGGDVDFSGGGVFEVEVDAGGGADRLDVGGTATLSGGSLRVVPLASLQELGESSDYTILTADGGLVGSFDSLSSTLAFLIPTLSQAGNSLFLNLTRLRFASAGETPNQTAVGAALDKVVDSGTTALDEIFDALLQLSPDGARQALDSLGGVQHTHAQALALEAGRQFQGAVLDRLGGRGGTGDIGGLGLALEDDGPARQLAAAGTGDGARDSALGDANRGLWVRGLGGFGSLDDSDNASGADYRFGGLVLGADGRVSDELVAGVALGYLRTDVDAAAADLDLDSFQLAGYGGWRHQAYYLQGVASVGYHGIDAVRGVTAGGFSDTATADYDGWTGGLTAEAGRDFTFGAATVTPFAGLAYSHLRRDGFTESGAGAANLSVESEDQDSLRSSLGLRLGHRFETAGGLEIRPVVEAAWVRENLDDVSALDAGFAAAPGSAFRISGPDLDRDRALLGAGVAAELGDGLRLGISYRGEIAASDRSHSLAASLRWRF